jgi:hypothetical protein
MPRCAWEAHLDPITVGFGDEEGVKLYLPFGSVIGHDKVLVTIICDDQSNRSSLLRMHGLSVEHKHVMIQLSLVTTMRITHSYICLRRYFSPSVQSCTSRGLRGQSFGGLRNCQAVFRKHRQRTGLQPSTAPAVRQWLQTTPGHNVVETGMGRLFQGGQWLESRNIQCTTASGGCRHDKPVALSFLLSFSVPVALSSFLTALVL